MTFSRHAPSGATLLLALFTLAACQEPPPAAEKPRPVRTVKATPIDGGEEITQTGEVRPHVETDLGFRIDGRVTSRQVEIGASVQKGELLATLDDTNVANELRAAEADLASTTAAESLAKTTLERQQILLDKQIVAQVRVDEADANWRSAKARLDAAASALANAKARLSYTRLLAPETGVITAIGANAGQVVPAGQMVVRLASSRERDAVFNVAESVINNAPPDIEVKVTLVSDPSVVLSGRVRDVSPTADPSTRTYRVRVALPDTPPLSYGAVVTGSVRYLAGRSIALPASALTAENGQPAVYVVEPRSKTLKRKPVTVSRYTASSIYVTSGLAAGDDIVTAGVSKLRPNQIVAFDGDVK